MIYRIIRIVYLVTISFVLISCANKTNAVVKESRDAKWATPIEAEGLPNFHQITPFLYRGAQPTSQGIQSLKEKGIKTIINLRRHHSDKDEIAEAKTDNYFNYIEIPTNTWALNDETTTQFLKIVQNRTNHPVFFHCQHGADRTGTMAAAYRIVVQGWTKEEAIREMKDGGYGFHSVWKHLPKYLESLDDTKIKRSIETPETND